MSEGINLGELSRAELTDLLQWHSDRITQVCEEINRRQQVAVPLFVMPKPEPATPKNRRSGMLAGRLPWKPIAIVEAIRIFTPVCEAVA